MTTPFSNLSTSLEAAEKIAKSVSRLEAEVFTYIINRQGATCDEVEEYTGLTHQTASARVWQLRKRGVIVDSGDRRKTRSGRRAIVWKSSIPVQVEESQLEIW